MNAILEQVNSAGLRFVEFALPMFVQSGVLILILLLADLTLRKKVRAVFRYWIWMLVLVKLVLPTSLSTPVSVGYFFGDELAYVNMNRPGTEAESRETAQAIVSPMINPSRIEASSDTSAIAPTAPTIEPTVIEPVNPPVASLSWQGAVFLLWVAVVLAMGLLLLQRAIFVRGLIAQAKEANYSMVDTLESCRERMGVKRKIGLKVSANASSPAVCGLFWPVILVPKNLASHLNKSQLKTVLLHELAHIRRGDLWVNLAQTILQIVYFYNPLFWAANAIIRRIREQAVDEMVLVAMGEKARQYPQTLVNVAKLAFKCPALSLRLIGVVESKSALAGRIKHILNRPMPKKAKLGILGLAVVIIIAAILLPMATCTPGPPSLVIKGTVKDAQTGEPIAGARVFDDGYAHKPNWEQIKANVRSEWGAITNSAGEYSFLTWAEHHTIKVEAPGYKSERQSLYDGHFIFKTKDEETFDFALEPEKASDSSGFKKTLPNGVTAKLPMAKAGKTDADSVLEMAGLVAYYPFEGDATDASSNNNHGSHEGTVDYVEGVIGKAVRFYGIDNRGYIKVPHSESLKFTDVVTIALWVRIEDGAGQTGLDGSGRKVPNAHQVFVAKSGDRVGFVVHSTRETADKRYIGMEAHNHTPRESGAYFAPEHPQKRWMHMAVIAGTSGTKLYYNGKLVKADNGPTDLSEANPEDMYIGIQAGKVSILPWWFPLNGMVDELCIYNRSLTAEEVKALYNMASSSSRMSNTSEELQFIATLSNGVTVELVGVCEHPSGDKQWWRPDGSLLENRPYEKCNHHSGSRGSKYELAFRIVNLPDPAFGWTVKSKEITVSALSEVSKDGRDVPDIRSAVVGFKEKSDKKDIRLGIAAGPWTGIGHHITGGITTTSDGIVFQRAVQDVEGNIVLNIIHNINRSEKSYRIVAIDKNGTEYKAHYSGGVSRPAQPTITETIFKNLKLSEVKEFFFQTRPYVWVEFKNISLRPGVKTDVQIEIEEESSESKMSQEMVGTWFFDNPGGDDEQMAIFPDGSVVVLYSNGHKDQTNYVNGFIELAEYDGAKYEIAVEEKGTLVLYFDSGGSVLIGRRWKRIDSQPRTDLLRPLTGPDNSKADIQVPQEIEEKIKILLQSNLDQINETSIEQTRGISAMRELARIGKPAVPELTAELHRTNGWLTKSLIAFVLRAIGDERAVPALVEALGQSKYRGEYGIYVKDDELANWMLDHQHREPDESDRKAHAIIIAGPVIEITKALEKITGHSEGPDWFSPETAEIVKQRWQKWWDTKRLSQY